MFGLTMVPISAPCVAPIERRVPGTPNAGPGWAATNSAGSASSSSRHAVSWPSSKRLPAVAASRVAMSVPMFSIGNSTLMRAAITSAGGHRDGSDGGPEPTGTRSTTRAPKRSRSSSLSPGTAVKVPLDCSPAITAAAWAGSAASMV